MTKTKKTPASMQLSSAKRLVIKVGSAILCGAHGEVRTTWLATLVDDIVRLRKAGREIIVVTSGAIALGKGRLGIDRSLRLEEKQAASAAGQAALIEAWQGAFTSHGITVAQILLTLDDTESRRRYLNARGTFRALLDFDAIPLVNENDTVATSEIRYGDNDRLAAHTAQITTSDTLIIFSDIDGLYTADPRRQANAKHMPLVEHVTPEIERSATGPNIVTGIGSGGMTTKIEAAKIAGAGGCATIIASGLIDNPVAAILTGSNATLIKSSGSKNGARRKWIGGRLKPAGRIEVDDGAVKALQDGASLLPTGVTRIMGRFVRGDAVTIAGQDGQSLGQGLSAYSSDEVKKIAGCRSEEIEKILGYRRRPAVIERDDLVLSAEQESE